MQQGTLESGALRLVVAQEGAGLRVAFTNTNTGEAFTPRRVFSVAYGTGAQKVDALVSDQDCKVVLLNGTERSLRCELKHGTLRFALTFTAGGDSFIRTQLEVSAEDPALFIDHVSYFETDVKEYGFTWSIPIPKERVHIPPYIMSLGQPVYAGSFYAGGEFPTADNKITNGTARFDLYYGRPMRELALGGSALCVHSCVVGAAKDKGYDACRVAFFDYMRTFARPEVFRLQFNSWYDNMLDITSENIAESFRAVAKGLKEHGVRNPDSYVVDDGWVDYKKREFWAFNHKRFPQEFAREKALMEELGSGFGVWFGPRGGYSAADAYAKKLQKLGYPRCRKSRDICTAAPNYIDALIERMLEFMRTYHVNYFKLDGFAIQPCADQEHGHPTGGKNDLYFYSCLWERWLAGFERLRAQDPNVYLNLTSYSHCSPWFLKWVDAVWLNNSSDMYYEGDGSNLDRCLNYRDGRYYDYYQVRQLQFPAGQIYNHEPCYGKKNYNPPLPAWSHKTVVYTDEEFTKYLLMCMMRGTGFVELYYSPSMFDGAKWEINARILNWAEEHFHILRHSEFFGGIPKAGNPYGYAAFENGKGFVIVRNPSNAQKTLDVPLGKYTLAGAHTAEVIYPQGGETCAAGEQMRVTLAPREIRLFAVTATK